MGSGTRRKGWGLFRSNEARSPMEVVRHARDLLTYVIENPEAGSSNHDGKHEHKVRYVDHFFSPSFIFQLNER
jgi:calcium binding protein 39